MLTDILEVFSPEQQCSKLFQSNRFSVGQSKGRWLYLWGQHESKQHVRHFSSLGDRKLFKEVFPNWDNKWGTCWKKIALPPVSTLMTCFLVFLFVFFLTWRMTSLKCQSKKGRPKPLITTLRGRVQWISINSRIVFVYIVSFRIVMLT